MSVRDFNIVPDWCTSSKVKVVGLLCPAFSSLLCPESQTNVFLQLFYV